jgi:hypothetical protein
MARKARRVNMEARKARKAHKAPAAHLAMMARKVRKAPAAQQATMARKVRKAHKAHRAIKVRKARRVNMEVRKAQQATMARKAQQATMARKVRKAQQVTMESAAVSLLTLTTAHSSPLEIRAMAAWALEAASSRSVPLITGNAGKAGGSGITTKVRAAFARCG